MMQSLPRRPCSVLRLFQAPVLVLILVLTVLVGWAPCHAFVCPRLYDSYGRRTSRGGCRIRPLADAFHEEHQPSSPLNNHQEIEAARKLFERLALNETTGTLQSTTTTSTMVTIDKPFPLTAQMERVRTTEIQLLQALDQSDDAVQPLVELWVKEKPAGGASQVLHEMMMHQVCPDIHQEEQTLRKLVHEHDMEQQQQQQQQQPPRMTAHHQQHPATVWVEPHARLAVLLFSKHEYDEALALCDYVLLIKPWHFEIAQLFRIALLRVGNWPLALRVTRELCLPPLHHVKRRAKWIQKMTQVAKERIEQYPLASSSSSRPSSIVITKPQPYDITTATTAMTTAIDSDECDVDNPNGNCFQ